MINTIITKRKSIRKFKVEGIVTEQQLQELLNAAMHAPSACNKRAWEFIVVTNRAKLNEVTTFHPYTHMLKTAQAAIIVNGLPEELKGTPGEGMWQHDCGAATQNILLQATDMDLGSCWCGLHPNENLMENMRKLFDIPVASIPFSIIAIGVPDEPFGGRGIYEEKKVKWMK